MGAKMDSLGTGAARSNPTRRLVIVADNSLIVEAIRIGFRQSGEFNLVGHADARRTSARTIFTAEPDVILLDDLDRSERALDLIREIKTEDERVAVIVLTVHMDHDWLERLFEAGAQGAISKATHPAALATLVRETLNGHIFHGFVGRNTTSSTALSGAAAEELPLTAREREILELVAAGSTNGEVARVLWVTEQTVKFHLRNIYRKLDVANRTQASRFAYANGLVGARSEPKAGTPADLAAVGPESAVA
jgi:DNA-binding NarL/FixJ family response regulator